MDLPPICQNYYRQASEPAFSSFKVTSAAINIGSISVCEKGCNFDSEIAWLLMSSRVALVLTNCSVQFDEFLISVGEINLNVRHCPLRILTASVLSVNCSN